MDCFRADILKHLTWHNRTIEQLTQKWRVEFHALSLRHIGLRQLTLKQHHMGVSEDEEVGLRVVHSPTFAEPNPLLRVNRAEPQLPRKNAQPLRNLALETQTFGPGTTTFRSPSGDGLRCLREWPLRDQFN